MSDGPFVYDVVFLHPPSSFLKTRYPLGGLFESATGTTDLLTMAPVGMLSLANELARSGLRIAVVNVGKLVQAVRTDPPDDFGTLLQPFPARIYAIGLHWAAHASGALELARICKRLRPDSRVLLGGLSSTYFCDEILMHHPAVDAVVLGECDGSIGSITDALLTEPMAPGRAVNLAYRRAGKVARTRRRAADLSVVDYIDSNRLLHPVPSRERMEREALLANIPVVRGCNQECLFCGGSRSAYRTSYGREGVELVPVDVVLDHFRRAGEAGLTGVKLFGDLRLGGRSYVEALIAGLASMPRRLDLYLELFWPADRDWLGRFRAVCADMHVSLSPESSHPRLRRAHGKRYDNQALLDLARDCRELEIGAWFFFTYLLPGHTPDSLAEELRFLGELMSKEPEVAVMDLPYLFMDPAAALFERPAEHGYEITFRTLQDIAAGMERAYWLHSIGYTTPAFDQQAFHRAILDMTAGQARLYFETGRMSARDLVRTHTNLACHRAMGDLLARRPQMPDQDIQAAVERTFPEALRRSNSSLLMRTFLGDPLGQAPAAAELIHDAFPWALELILRAEPDGDQGLAARIDAWHRERAAQLLDFTAACEPPPAVLDFVADLLAPMGLAPAFVEDLLRLEWDLYRLIAHGATDISGVSWGADRVVKPYGYDMTDLDELLAACPRRGTSPPPARTFYVFDLALREVYSANFDPLSARDTVPDARVRRLSALARTLVRTDPALRRLIERALGVADPGKPATTWAGRPLAATQFEGAFSPAEKLTPSK